MSTPDMVRHGYTIKDWTEWDGNWELIHGSAYPLEPTLPPQHLRATVRLVSEIHQCLERSRRRDYKYYGEVLHAPFDLYFPNEQSVYHPDIIVINDSEMMTDRGIFGIPALIIEVLSSGTAGLDLTKKRSAYENAGVPEYLIVDPDLKIAILLELLGDRYIEKKRIEWGDNLRILKDKVLISIK